MEAYIVGGHEEVFIIQEFLYVVGEPHVQDVVGLGLVDFLAESFAYTEGQIRLIAASGTTVDWEGDGRIRKGLESLKGDRKGSDGQQVGQHR